jgi:hypothetical protein
MTTTYEEWRVTGAWDGSDVDYEFSPARGRSIDPEAAARKFVAQVANRGWAWTDGPHLHKRTVTVTDWQEAES